MSSFTRPPFDGFPNKPATFGVFEDFLKPVTGWTATAIASGTAALRDDITGGAIRLSGAATTDDSGVNYQATNSGFGLELGKSVQFLARFRFGESTSSNMPDQSDLWLGLANVDTSVVASAPTAFIGFRKDDGDALLDCVIRGAGAEVAVVLGAATLAKNVWYEVAIQVTPDPTTSGRGSVTYWLNGTQIASITVAALPMSAASILTPVCAFQSGDNTGTKFLDLDYIGAQEVR